MVNIIHTITIVLKKSALVVTILKAISFVSSLSFIYKVPSLY